MNDLLLNWRTHDEVVIQTAERCREYTPTDVCVFMSVTHMLADWGKPGGQGGFCHQILSLLLPLLLLTSFTLHGTSEEFHSNPNFKFLESLEGGRRRRREVGEEGGGGGRGRRGGEEEGGGGFPVRSCRIVPRGGMLLSSGGLLLYLYFLWLNPSATSQREILCSTDWNAFILKAVVFRCVCVITM